MIASDLGHLEVFLWSASSGNRPFAAFSWELLDGYHAQLSASETPLASYVTTIRQAYITNRSELPFCDGKVFARVSLAFP